MTYYPQSPDDWTDGDWEMVRLEELAAKAERDRKRGNCHHGWTGPSKNDPTVFVCYHCGHEFGSCFDRDKALGIIP